MHAKHFKATKLIHKLRIKDVLTLLQFFSKYTKQNLCWFVAANFSPGAYQTIQTDL